MDKGGIVKGVGALGGESPSHLPTVRVEVGGGGGAILPTLGWGKQSITLDTYAHITSAAQRQAAQTMGSVLAGTVQN